MKWYHHAYVLWRKAEGEYIPCRSIVVGVEEKKRGVVVVDDENSRELMIEIYKSSAISADGTCWLRILTKLIKRNDGRQDVLCFYVTM